jgi:hypothetical protein
MRYFNYKVILLILLATVLLAASCKTTVYPASLYITRFARLTAVSVNDISSSYDIAKSYFTLGQDLSTLANENIVTLYYGDANEDGFIDMGDTVMVELIILGRHLTTNGADANLDKTLDMGDVVTIEQIILGIINPRPIEPSIPVIKTITVTDADLPAPPVSGMTFHFVTPNPGDPGLGKIRASYGFLSYSIWFGVDHNQLWVFNLPERESLPASFVAFYDSLGIDENAVYEEETGKYWFNSIPPWIDISKYDPTLTTMPVLVSASSTSGQAQISYMPASQ